MKLNEEQTNKHVRSKRKTCRGEYQSPKRNNINSTCNNNYNFNYTSRSNSKYDIRRKWNIQQSKICERTI